MPSVQKKGSYQKHRKKKKRMQWKAVVLPFKNKPWWRHFEGPQKLDETTRNGTWFPFCHKEEHVKSRATSVAYPRVNPHKGVMWGKTIQWFPKWGPGTSRNSIPQGTCQKCNSQAPPQIYWIRTLEVRTRNLYFKKPSRWFWHIVKFENRWPSLFTDFKSRKKYLKEKNI